MRRLWLFIALCACSKVQVDLTGRPCDAGERCSDDFDCHPDYGRCVPEIYVSCEDPAGVCPDNVQSDTPCAQPGSFITCDTDYRPCERGCRTCGDDHTWGPCSVNLDCDLGTPATCASCVHDCTALVANAFATCEAGVCSYAGDCDPNTGDADGRADNGCECLERDGAIELCDGFDNDCNGTTDDDNGDCSGTTPLCSAGLCVCSAESCGSGRWCDAGSCRDCADDDPLHCGVACDACTGATPLCDAGGCACAGASCGTARWCDAGVCRDCALDDELHCGVACAVCGGEQPECVAGACSCTSGSCPTGESCDGGGACALCDTAARCGPTCAACPPGQNVCNPVNGACTCTAGSCPVGQFCQSGTCRPCNCPGIFPECTDAGGVASCRCAGSSCTQDGVCEGGGKVCRWSDNLDSGSGTSICSGTGFFNSSWQHSSNGCRSGACWGTRFTSGTYRPCEASCMRTAALPLQGVTGAIDVRFWASYLFEFGFDGSTVRFQPNVGNGVTIEPVTGWDIDALELDEAACTAWADPKWPGWGQYASPDARPFHQKHFHIESSAHPELFHNGFYWRVYCLSDSILEYSGMRVDDIEVTVTQSP